MDRKFRLTGIVLFFSTLCLVCLLLLPAVFLPSSADTKDLWPHFSLETTNSIHFTGPRSSFLLVREQDTWFIQRGKELPRLLADTEKIATLLHFLNNNPPTSLDTGTASTPVTNFPFSVTINEDFSLLISLEKMTGALLPAHSNTTQSLSLLPTAYEAILQRDFLHYALMASVQVDTEAISRLRVVPSRGDAWTVARKQENFVFTEPAMLTSARVFTEKIKILLHDVISLRAKTFLDSIPQPGNKEPDIQIQLWTHSAAQAHTLKLFRQADKKDWIGLSSLHSTAFTLDSSRVEKINKEPFSLVDRHLTTLDTGKAHKLLIHQGLRKFSASRKGTVWYNTKTDAEVTGIDTFLWRITDMQYAYGPVEALPGAVEKALFLRIEDAQQAALVELWFYTDATLPPGQCWVSHNLEQGFFPVSDQLLKDFQGHLPVS